jgi:putative oxidoreductase
MNILGCRCGEKWRDEAYTALRVVTGLMFLTHGYAKFTMGAEAVAGFFGSAGVPLPGLVAHLVMYGEILVGIALILGLVTHWAAKLGIIIILGAIFFVHLENGYGAANGGYEYPLMILAACVLILTTGGGKYSLDAKRSQRQEQMVV